MAPALTVALGRYAQAGPGHAAVERVWGDHTPRNPRSALRPLSRPPYTPDSLTAPIRPGGNSTRGVRGRLFGNSPAGRVPPDSVRAPIRPGGNSGWGFAVACTAAPRPP